MVSERPKKIGGACERVWSIADELAEQIGGEPRLPQVRERYAAEGGNPNTAATQFSLWLKEYRHRQSRNGERPEANGTSSTIPAHDGVFSLTIAENGRVVIPKELREKMLLDADGAATVTARLVDGELRLISRRAAIRRAQKALAPLKREGESIVDEFLAERRAMWGEE